MDKALRAYLQDFTTNLDFTADIFPKKKEWVVAGRIFGFSIHPTSIIIFSAGYVKDRSCLRKWRHCNRNKKGVIYPSYVGSHEGNAELQIGSSWNLACCRNSAPKTERPKLLWLTELIILCLNSELGNSVTHGEVSSSAPTLGSSVRIPLEAWIFVYILCLCCHV